MSALRKPSLKGLYAPDRTTEDKRVIQELTKKLNDLLASDPRLSRKAALVLEHWLHKKPR
jgi:hypothetical protein